MELRIIAAGRAALADAANVGVNAVRVTKVLVGSGQGPGGVADDARTALRNQRDSAVAGGSTMVAARVLVRGDVAATAAYNITEVGLEARIGAGAPFLFAYWSNAGEVFAAAVDGVTVLVIAAVDVVAETPAQLTVDVDPTVQANFSATFAALTDTQAGPLVANNYYRANAAGTTLTAMTAAEVLADIFSGIASARYVRKSGNGFQALTRGEVAQDLLASIGGENFLRRASGGGFEGLTAAATAAALLAAAPMRLLAYEAGGAVQGPAYACRWLVLAWGAGGGGGGGGGPGADGGRSSLTGGGLTVRADGGVGGPDADGAPVTAAVASGAVAGALGGLAVPGAGAGGGRGRGGNGQDPGYTGLPGGLAVALVNPAAGQAYAVAVGAGGAGGASNNDNRGSPGGAGRVVILELRGP